MPGGQKLGIGVQVSLVIGEQKSCAVAKMAFVVEVDFCYLDFLHL